MSNPIFLHILTNGEVWAGNSAGDTPSGTIAATIKLNSDLKFQKVATLAGTANSNLTSTGHTGKFGKETS